MLTKQDLTLLRDLETCVIPAGQFRHADHVRAAWAMLQEQTLDHVIPRFGAALRRFAEHHNAPGLYHETMTRAFLLAIDERIRRSPSPQPWEGFSASNPELLGDHRVFLERHYSPEVLESDLARRTFLEPDREPIGERRTALA